MGGEAVSSFTLSVRRHGLEL